MKMLSWMHGCPGCLIDALNKCLGVRALKVSQEGEGEIALI